MRNNTIIKIGGLCTALTALTGIPLSAAGIGCQAPAAESGRHAPRERAGEWLKPGRPEAYTRGITGEAGYASREDASMTARASERDFRVTAGRPEAFTRGMTGGFGVGGFGVETTGRGFTDRIMDRSASVTEEKSITGRPEEYTRGICPLVERG
jgi:hypothetical protein